MGAYNRYRQPVQALQFAPRSTETLAKTGMMKAGRDISQMQFANTMDLTYDVFSEQEDYVGQQLDPLKKDIDSLVDSIANNDGGDRTNKLLNMKKEYDSKLGMNSEIWKTMQQKRAFQTYQTQMANRQDALGAGVAQGLIAESRANYIDGWDADKRSEFQADIGIKNSGYQEKGRLIGNDMMRNPEKYKSSWDSINKKNGKGIYSVSKGGKTVFYTKDGEKLTERQTKEHIAEATEQYLLNDKGVVADLEQRARLGLIDSVEGEIKKVSENIGDIYQVNNTFNDVGHKKLMTVDNGGGKSTGSDSKKIPPRTIIGGIKQKNVNEKMDAIKDTEEGTWTDGAYEDWEESKKEGGKELDDKYNKESLVYADEALSGDKSYIKKKNQVTYLDERIKVTEQRRVKNADDYKNKKITFDEARKNEATILKTRKLLESKKDTLEDEISTKFNSKVVEFKEREGFDYTQNVAIDPSEVKDIKLFKEQSQNVLSYFGDELTSIASSVTVNGEKVTDDAVLQSLRFDDLKTTGQIQFDSKNSRITFNVEHKVGDKNNPEAITFDLNNMSANNRTQVIGILSKMYGAESPQLKALISKARLDEVYTGGSDGVGSVPVPNYDNQTINVGGQDWTYSMDASTISHEDENGDMVYSTGDPRLSIYTTDENGNKLDMTSYAGAMNQLNKSVTIGKNTMQLNDLVNEVAGGDISREMFDKTLTYLLNSNQITKDQASIMVSYNAAMDYDAESNSVYYNKMSFIKDISTLENNGEIAKQYLYLDEAGMNSAINADKVYEGIRTTITE